MRINVLVSSFIPERYGVMAKPTFKLFCAGRPFQEMVGAVRPALLRRMLKGVYPPVPSAGGDRGPSTTTSGMREGALEPSVALPSSLHRIYLSFPDHLLLKGMILHN